MEVGSMLRLTGESMRWITTSPNTSARCALHWICLYKLTFIHSVEIQQAILCHRVKPVELYCLCESRSLRVWSVVKPNGLLYVYTVSYCVRIRYAALDFHQQMEIFLPMLLVHTWWDPAEIEISGKSGNTRHPLYEELVRPL